MLTIAPPYEQCGGMIVSTLPICDCLSTANGCLASQRGPVLLCYDFGGCYDETVGRTVRMAWCNELRWTLARNARVIQLIAIGDDSNIQRTTLVTPLPTFANEVCLTVESLHFTFAYTHTDVLMGSGSPNISIDVWFR